MQFIGVIVLKEICVTYFQSLNLETNAGPNLTIDVLRFSLKLSLRSRKEKLDYVINVLLGNEKLNLFQKSDF